VHFIGFISTNATALYCVFVFINMEEGGQNEVKSIALIGQKFFKKNFKKNLTLT
jgi:hypothetical protein